MEQRFAEALAQRRRSNRLRRLRAVQPAPAGRLAVDGRSMLDFSSNDYLGLSHHPLLAERAAAWARDMGTSSRASRLVTGTLEAHQRIEEKIAAFKGTEAALLFSSGWQANASLLPALIALEPQAAVFTDKLIHASLHQGMAASGAKQIRFRHNDLGHLEELLDSRGGAAPVRMIVVESVYSMDGDRADMQRLSDIAQRHDAFLIVDEAHATGVLGQGGAGLCADLAVKPGLVMGTFSKAMGGFGAYVAGSRALCDYLANASSGFIYSTALPPSVLGAIDAALDLVPTMEAERAHLAGLGERLRAGLAGLGLQTGPSSTQIVPVMVGEESAALDLAARLEAEAMLGIAIRPPTVPVGSSRLRLALSAAHSPADVDALLHVLDIAR